MESTFGIADQTQTKIYRLDMAGNIISSIDSPNINPSGLAFNDNHLWVSCANGMIYKVNFSGNIVDSFSSPTLTPNGLAFGGGYLWNTDSLNGKVYKLDSSTGEILFEFPSLGGPGSSGLTFDGLFLWNSNWTTNEIYKYEMKYGNPYDKSNDGTIDNFELLDAIDCWADMNCTIAPQGCNSNFYLLSLINLWATGEYIKNSESGDPCFSWEPKS